MTENDYRKISNKIRKYKYGEQIVRKLNLFSTSVVYIIYILVVVFMIITKECDVIRIVAVTAVSFIGVSYFRKKFDAPRPYTVYNYEPIIKKEKEGNSFPSRHVFSAFVIATTFIYANLELGICLFAISCLIAVLRVIGGVHFPKGCNRRSDYRKYMWGLGSLLFIAIR